MDEPSKRRWHHPWLGEMWGRVPVGVIGAVLFLLIWGLYFYMTAD